MHHVGAVQQETVEAVFDAGFFMPGLRRQGRDAQRFAQVGMRRAGPDDRMLPEKRLFGFSIVYLFALFAALVADRLAAAQGWFG